MSEQSKVVFLISKTFYRLRVPGLNSYRGIGPLAKRVRRAATKCSIEQTLGTPPVAICASPEDKRSDYQTMRCDNTLCQVD